MKRNTSAASEALLRAREPWYVSACGRFLSRSSRDHVWTLRGREANISALIVYSRKTLLPVFNSLPDIPFPFFLNPFFTSLPLHAVQGLKREALILEEAVEKAGLRAVQNIDYDLMALNDMPGESCFLSGPRGLVLRRPLFTDADALFPLQAAYEREEVLPIGAEFNASACRLGLERILSGGQILAAELEGRIVGKINTSVVSFTRYQIGGVYVHPDYRGLGIARRMTAEFARALILQGRGLSLFVKKLNPAARRVYDNTGFKVLADYRISYY
ncbi:MAG: GNAT family N-acetyltransferase [Treponema sp.]|nr:GNAT family N-acetyltransferase [Treponema sp.]